jgi:hypothetical protein
VTKTIEAACTLRRPTTCVNTVDKKHKCKLEYRQRNEGYGGTDEPIVAQIHPCKRSKTRLILHPSCRLTTSLAKGELSLHPHSPTRTRTDWDVSNLVFEKALDLEEGRLFDSAGSKISLSTIFRGPWNVVHVSKWRVFSFKV